MTIIFWIADHAPAVVMACILAIMGYGVLIGKRIV